MCIFPGLWLHPNSWLANLWLHSWLCSEHFPRKYFLILKKLNPSFEPLHRWIYPIWLISGGESILFCFFSSVGQFFFTIQVPEFWRTPLYGPGFPSGNPRLKLIKAKMYIFQGTDMKAMRPPGCNGGVCHRKLFRY